MNAIRHICVKLLPLEPYNDCKGCVYKNADTDRQEVLIERMITEIFDQKNL